MTALIVTGCVAALLLLLLLAPISLDLSYRRGGMDLRVRYLFFRVILLREKPEKKQKKQRKKQKEQALAGEEPEEKKGGSTLATVWGMVKSSRRGFRILRRHLIFSRVRVYLRVGGEDAHQTAMACAKLGAAVMAALDIIQILFVLRRPRVAIVPDFTRSATEADISLRIGIRPLFALMAGVNILYRFLRLERGKKPVRPEEIKGGKTV